MSSSLLRAGLTAAFGLVLAAHAFAADPYPSRTTTIVVPFAPGGSTDTVARLVAANLQTELGQPFIVENRAGASGNLAAAYVARAEPDGYTLFMGTSTSIANMTLFKKLNYDMLTDFVPVSQAVFTPVVLIASPSLPANSIAELIAYAKSNKGKVTYGSGGNGTSQHLAGVLLERMAHVEMVHVPYRGAAPAVTDLMGGNLQILFPPLVDALPYIDGGKVKVLGLTTSKPSPRLPGVPLVASVLPGFDVATWNGIFAPARTPPEVVDKLAAAMGRIMRRPEVIRIVEEQGSEPIGSTPAEFKAYVASEAVLWRKLVEMSGASIE
jgi:tripartite-type tricarboxylate transporter receptor subunit TctC